MRRFPEQLAIHFDGGAIHEHWHIAQGLDLIVQDRRRQVPCPVASDALERVEVDRPHAYQVFAEAASRRHGLDAQQLRRDRILTKGVQIGRAPLPVAREATRLQSVSASLAPCLK